MRRRLLALSLLLAAGSGACSGPASPRPDDPAPHAALSGSAPASAPPACFHAERGDDQRRLLSAIAPDERSLSICVEVEPETSEPGPWPPACFTVDLASGVYRSRALTAHEAHWEAEPPATSVKVDGERVTVCRAGAGAPCRDFKIPGLPDHTNYEPSVAVDDAGALVAAIIYDAKPVADEAHPTPRSAVLFDAATGRRQRAIRLGTKGGAVAFVGETLMVTENPCAGPCATSDLYDPRTGRRIAKVGGDKAVNTEYAPAKVAGTVYAFTDLEQRTIVYQDVATGRVVQRFEATDTGCGADSEGRTFFECGGELRHAGGGVALLDSGAHAGDFTLYDERGQVVAHHKLPVCKTPPQQQPAPTPAP